MYLSQVMPKVLGVIPARYASVRFPGKSLQKIGFRPMIQWTWEAANQCKDLDRLIIATDDERIREVVNGFGGEVLMTSEDHASGTDRLTEVAQIYPDYDIIVNIQGDEPGIESSLISGVVRLKIEHPEWEMTTAARPILIDQKEDPLVPERVKVVLSKRGKALYFSRSLIPFPRNKNQLPVHVHLGIYVYGREALMRFHTLPKSELEKAESLEQLRALENDFSIGVYITNVSLPPVDTPEDLAYIRSIFKKKGLID